VGSGAEAEEDNSLKTFDDFKIFASSVWCGIIFHIRRGLEGTVVEEKVYFVLERAVRKKGMFRSQRCTVVVTNRRLIVAVLTRQMEKEWMNEARKKVKERYQQMRSEGKGKFSSGMGAVMEAYNFYDRYYEMSPDEILSENPENFAIESSQIKKIHLTYLEMDGDSGGRDRLSINVVWSGGKENINYEGRDIVKELTKFFKEHYSGVKVSSNVF